MHSSSKKRASFLGFIALFLIFIAVFSVFSSLSKFLHSEPRSTLEDAEFPTVIIDAGHGGEDGGAVGVGGVLEKDINLNIARALYDSLSAKGISCVMTRTEDTLLYDRNADYEGRKKALDAKARLEIAAKYENAIFVSIHQNSYPVAKYSGFQVYYSKNIAESAIIARELENAVREKLQPENNRASKEAGSNIYLMQKLTCPAVLLECGFISNPEECKALSSEEYQQRLTEVLCDAIVGYINNKQTV